ncbi:MAG: sensor domain-containing diguanylate cyclase [Deltaproteobacteria bacterium]|nr:sensor domain-containing diguanylate cyclase [Deltaproteobacteria bacterium]
MENLAAGKALKDMTDIFNELLDSLSTLYALSNIHIPLISERELFFQAAEVLVEHYGFDCCSMYVYEEDALSRVAGLTWQQWESSEPGGGKDVLTPEDTLFLQTVMALATQAREPQICDDCHVETLYSRMAKGVIPVRIGCLISAPILMGQEILGILNVSYPCPHFLNDWQKRLVPVFSRFLGQIVTSNRLMNNLEREVQIRTRQLDSLLEETRRMEQHYQELAMIDDLTGLFNRRFFFSEAKRNLGRALRHQHPFTMLVIDLDRFKSVNDNFGHVVGDTVLQDVARAVRQVLRETDIFARTGGEEFAVALPETDTAGGRDLSERILTAIKRLSWVANGSSFSITASLGMSCITAQNIVRWEEMVDRVETSGRPSRTHHSFLLDRLYSEADTAMYIAKRRGGGQVAQLAEIL